MAFIEHKDYKDNMQISEIIKTIGKKRYLDLYLAIQYVAQFSYGPSFRTKRTLFDYFRRSFKSSLIEEYRK